MKKRINIHERSKEVVRLVKSRLLSVEADHECALKSFKGQPSFAASNQTSVDLRVEDGVELFLLLPVVRHFVSANALVGLFLKREQKLKLSRQILFIQAVSQFFLCFVK